MKSFFSTSFVLAAIPFVCGHGIVTSPPARAAGPAMEKVCGQQVTNQQTSDNGGNVQGELQVAQSQKDYDPTQCNLFLCKGYQFGDNTANVQTFTPGQVVPIKVAIKAPHTGVCNVSIVDTKANALIGQPLITFTDYASNSHPIPANNTDFSITMPQDLAGKCTQAGDCVVQWFWDAPDIKQTYESCVDFTMGGAAPAARVKPRQAESSSSTGSKTKASKTDSTGMETMTMGPKTTMTFSAMSGVGAGNKTAKSTGKDSITSSAALTGTKVTSSIGSTSTSSVVQSNEAQSMNGGSLASFFIASSVSLSLLLLI